MSEFGHTYPPSINYSSLEIVMIDIVLGRLLKRGQKIVSYRPSSSNVIKILLQTSIRFNCLKCYFFNLGCIYKNHYESKHTFYYCNQTLCIEPFF